MGTQNSRGFTIIEVMLFLAVTGALAVGILVGSGVAINQQRYRDSVSSLKSLLQQQYSEVTNVANNRTGAESCTNAVITAPPNPVPTPQPRGTSDCLSLGRYISVSSDGTKVTTTTVVGYRTADTATVPLEPTDSEELKHYKLSLSPIDTATEDVAWSAQIVQPKTSTALPLSMLILSSPLSGTIMTFVSANPQPDLNAFVQTGQNTVPTNLCIRPSGGSFTGRQMAVRIDAYATSQAAIEIPPESEGVCG